jgi:O-antigen ligase
MNLKIIKNLLKLELLFGCASIYLIPINKHLVTIVMLFWLLFSIINFTIEKINNQTNLIFSKKLFPFILIPLFYLIHIIGLCYTSNFEYGFFDLEVKLSMLLIPIVLWLRFNFYKEKQIILLQSLIFGSLSSFFINVTSAGIHYYSHPDIDFFFYTFLTPIHPSYVALYVSLSIFIFLFIGSKQIFFNLKKSSFLGLLSFIILLIYLFLLSSKAGIIIFIITLITYLAIRFSHKIKVKFIIFIASIIIIFFGLIIHFTPTIQKRFQPMINAIIHSNEANLDSGESSMERIALYVTSTKLAYHKLPWGVGTGDTKDEITENYKKLGSKTINERYLNAHNQYLQTTITLGILGLISLLLILVGGFRFAFNKKNILFFSFLILITLNMLFESMLEQQAGVIFITLFYTFFCIWGDNNKITEPTKSIQ